MIGPTMSMHSLMHAPVRCGHHNLNTPCSTYGRDPREDSTRSARRLNTTTTQMSWCCHAVRAILRARGGFENLVNAREVEPLNRGSGRRGLLVRPCNRSALAHLDEP